MNVGGVLESDFKPLATAVQDVIRYRATNLRDVAENLKTLTCGGKLPADAHLIVSGGPPHGVWTDSAGRTFVNGVHLAPKKVDVGKAKIITVKGSRREILGFCFPQGSMEDREDIILARHTMESPVVRSFVAKGTPRPELLDHGIGVQSMVIPNMRPAPWSDDPKITFLNLHAREFKDKGGTFRGGAYIEIGGHPYFLSSEHAEKIAELVAGQSGFKVTVQGSTFVCMSCYGTILAPMAKVFAPYGVKGLIACEGADVIATTVSSKAIGQEVTLLGADGEWMRIPCPSGSPIPATGATSKSTFRGTLDVGGQRMEKHLLGDLVALYDPSNGDLYLSQKPR